MKKQAIVLFASEYDFQNEEGERISGLTVHLLSDKVNQEGAKGYRVAKLNLPKEFKHELKTVPCLVEAYFNFTVNAQNKATLYLEGIKYIKDYQLEV